MSEERLVYMANQIAMFFRTAPKEQAVASTLDHLRKFWEPRMRGEIVHYLRVAQGKGLNEIALGAVQALAATPAKQG